MLARYRHLEDIPPAATDWEVEVRGAERLAGILATRRNEALLYRDLIRLATDVPLRETVDDLEWHGAHRAKMRGLVDRLDVEDAVEGIPRWTS